MRSNEVQGLAAPAVDISELGVADADRVLQHRSKHWLKITRGAADDLKHLRRRRLLLPGLVQFAGEASDLCIVDRGGRGRSFGRIAALCL